MRFIIASICLLIAFSATAQEIAVVQDNWSKRFYSDGVELKASEVKLRLNESKAASNNWKAARTFQGIETFSNWTGLVACIAGLSLRKGEPGKKELQGIGLGTIAVGLVSSLSANEYFNKAIADYNKELKAKAEDLGLTPPPPSHYFGLGVSENGIGLHFSF